MQDEAVVQTASCFSMGCSPWMREGSELKLKWELSG